MAKAITAAKNRPIGIISADRKNTVPGQSRASMRTSKPTTADRMPETRPSAAKVGAGRSRHDLSEGTGFSSPCASQLNKQTTQPEHRRQLDGPSGKPVERGPR